MKHSVVESLVIPNTTKIVLLVLDGLGDLPTPEQGMMTPLEAARTPNMDQLAPTAALARLTPVEPGVTPGSGPGHLGLFGYDPIDTVVGRGVLEAIGADMDLKPGDVAARANFCTLGANGIVTDRRAGRISSEKCAELVAKLQTTCTQFEDVEVILKAGKGHRFVAVLRGPGLGGDVSDADPHKEGKPIPAAHALVAGAGNEKTARIVNAFTKQVAEVLEADAPANAALARGFSERPNFPGYQERFQLRAGAFAAYPMYRGVAQLAGMALHVPAGDSAADAIALAASRWSDFDFFFVHVKGTDMAGEDGNFAAKVSVIEAADAALPQLLSLKPDVLCVTGDHSTPCMVKGHSWHPIPAMICGKWCFADGFARFTEKNCRGGSFANLMSKDLMPVLMANAARLDKFGA